MNFDDCALRFEACFFLIIAATYLTVLLSGVLFTLSHYLFETAVAGRKRKQGPPIPLDNLAGGRTPSSQPKEKLPDGYALLFCHVYRTWHEIRLYKRLHWVLYFSIPITIVASSVVILMAYARHVSLHESKSVAREKRVYETWLNYTYWLQYTYWLRQNLSCAESERQPSSFADVQWPPDDASFERGSGGAERPRWATANPDDPQQLRSPQLAGDDWTTAESTVAADDPAPPSAHGPDECASRFRQLVGYEARNYVGLKSASFDVRGNLDFWKYFRRECERHDGSLKRGRPLEDADAAEDVFLLSDATPARVSADGRFLLYDCQIGGPDFEQLSRLHKVTVATQTSMDRLLTFAESYRYWTGPISLAVFLKGPVEYFLLRSYVQHLKLCRPKYYRQTCFSIATPLKSPIPRNILVETTTFDEFNCSSRSNDMNVVFKKQLTETNAWLEEKHYAQNMMRNLARANIKSDYHLTLDIDIVPCWGMSEKLNKFLNESFVASALVIPTYEISRKINFPRTKRELVSLTKRKLAQPFHKDTFLRNQNATDFQKWEKIHDSFEDVHIVHEVKLFPMFYEPFFVELQSNPLFDENFIGYGFTRSSHAFEVFVRNGNFLVLSPIFTAEIGIKKVKNWSTSRQQQNESNRKRFNDFITNITSQFPDVQNVQNKDGSTSYYLNNSVNNFE